MAELDGQEKLRGDCLRDLFENYSKLETWGASLFLGALGLVARQLIEWDAATDKLKRVALAPEAFALPALMGMAAFLFLRIVNFRSHKVMENLNTLTGAGRQRTCFPLIGALGLVLAWMPLALGFAVSWYLATGYHDRQVIILMLLWCFGVPLVVVAIVVHGIIRFREWSKARSQMPNPPSSRRDP